MKAFATHMHAVAKRQKAQSSERQLKRDEEIPALRTSHKE